MTNKSTVAPAIAPAMIRLNVFAGARDKTPSSQRDLTWPELCDELTALAATEAAPGDPKSQKLTLPAFTLGTLREAYNVNANVEHLTALAIDVDRADLYAIVDRLNELNLAALVYGSPSDDDASDVRRLRVIAALSEPVLPEHVEHARKAFAEALGIGPGCGVETAIAVSQIMFVGRLHGTPERECYRIEGEPLDVPTLLATPLARQWRKAPKHAPATPVERVAFADPDERTAALLALLLVHWEAPGESTQRRQVLRALGGYLAKRGWADEQIAALGRGLETARPETARVALMLECAAHARANPASAAGWSTITGWAPDAAAQIEALAKDPREPDGFVDVWSEWWGAVYGRRAERAAAAERAENDDDGADVFAPAANTSSPPAPAADDKRTDLGNARRLVRGYGESLRYFEARKLWYVWDGARWKVDSTGEIVRAAKDAAESLWTEAQEVADDEKRKAAFAWAAKCQDRQRLMNMIELAKSEPGIPVVAADLDSHPWLLNVQNGTLDLRTGELSEPDPTLLMTKCCATHYDPAARSELWEAFVTRTTGGDVELAAYIQRSLGYALFGAWREKAFWFGYGPPDGAKSTLLGAIGDVLGDYHVAASASTWMVQNNVGGNRGDVTRLLGARFVTSLEIRPGLRFDEELVKKVTGGDMIVAAGKYENEIQFPPTFALWMGANDRPTIRDDDEGMWSRMRCVPFTNPVPDAEKDPHLREKLTGDEHAPAVLAWLVAGCLDWQREGVGKCAAVTRATSAYRADMNRAGAFFEECCELEAGAATSAKAMRHAYEEWCRANAIRTPLAANALGQRLRALGATGGDDQSRRVVHPARAPMGTLPAAPAVKDRFWFGVRLRAAE